MEDTLKTYLYDNPILDGDKLLTQLVEEGKIRFCVEEDDKVYFYIDNILLGDIETSTDLILVNALGTGLLKLK